MILRCEEKIATAILTKSLDEMKRAIFICLLMKRKGFDFDKAEKIIRENYVKYFK